ncbi:MFS transporter [Gammaproteobacteria bacterium]|nr:MFS transporter [Gammaproteobacteria bacterium]
MKRVILYGLIGNAISWFDFAVYAQLSHIIGAQVFSSSSTINALKLVWAIFAVSFLARPLGGFILTRLRVLYGERSSMASSSICTISASLILALMPVEGNFAIYSPYLLILSRLLLGFSIGGEVGASTVYLVENSGQGRQGLLGSIAMFGIMLGFFFASCVTFISTYYLSPEELLTIGWRIPFALSGFLGIFGLLFRWKMSKTYVGKHAQAEEDCTQLSLIKGLPIYHRHIMRLMAVYTLAVVTFFLVVAYFVSLNHQSAVLSSTQATMINMAVTFTVLITTFVSGYISDRLGIEKTLILSSCLLVVLSPILLFKLLDAGLIESLTKQVGFSILVGMYMAPLPAYLVSALPTQFRYVGISFIYNITSALLGGVTPFFATITVAYFSATWPIACYVMLFSLVAVIVLNLPNIIDCESESM